jgi:hypothetical protein
MTGVSNEGAEHGHGKLEEVSSRDEEPSHHEKEDKTRLTKAANSQGKRKGGSDRSEPVDDDSDKNGNVPLSFPQRVSCFRAVFSVLQVVCFDLMAFVCCAYLVHRGLSTYNTHKHEYRPLNTDYRQHIIT